MVQAVRHLTESSCKHKHQPVYATWVFVVRNLRSARVQYSVWVHKVVSCVAKLINVTVSFVMSVRPSV